MNKSSRPVVGIACVLGAASLWGTTGTARALADSSVSSMWFGALRLLTAAAFFLVFAAATGGLQRSAWRRLSPSDALGAGLCMAVYNLAFFAGVQATGVAVGTSIALGSGPIWAGLLQSGLQRMKPSPAWWAATGVAVAGGVLLSIGGGNVHVGVSWHGVALCLLSGLSYAVYTLLNKRMVRQAPASSITLAAFSLASLVAITVALIGAGLPDLGARDIAAAGYTGIVTAGVAYLLFSHALHHISPATGVTLALGEPVVAFALAVFVLGEPAGAASLAGLALVVAGVLGVVRAELGGRRHAISSHAPRVDAAG
ncbi:MAG TPA: DMT family transporter [Burkholderiaceae bacterium]|nr:DMT family transporter [Burkholderiaceae bacterium]